MKNKKVLITAIVTIVLAIAGMIFGITYTDEDVKEISEGIEAVVNVVEENQSTTEIPEAYVEDEIALEEQETEDEGFELQGEIAYNGASEYPSVSVGAYTGLTYYSQIDNRWKNLPYTSIGDKSQTIGSSACGPTCSAMVVSSIKGNISPVEMADLYVKYGFRSANNGTYWSAYRWTADVFDIGYTETIYLNTLCDLLEQGYMAITGCGNGLFTTGGHFIVVYGYEDTNGNGQCDNGDNLKIFDPYLYSGKFNTSTRRGKATVIGNTVYVEKETFRTYANYGTFFCFKNDRTTEEIKEETKATTTNVKIASYTRYVKVNTYLNIRSGSGTNYSSIGKLYNGDKVTVYEENGSWARIGDNQWASSNYLTDSNVAIKNTVGQTFKLKHNTNLYSRSDLSGTRYSYLKNTRIKVLKNISATVDYIYISATGRYAYINNSAYTTNATVSYTVTGVNNKGKYKYFKSNTIIYSNSNLSGTKYYYLLNTKVYVIEDLGSVNKIKSTATGRIGYVSENVYK